MKWIVALVILIVMGDTLLAAETVKSKAAAPRKSKPAPTTKDFEQQYINLIEYGNSQLDHLRYSERNCVDCFATGAATGYSTLDAKSPGQICKDKWTDFYSKENVDIRFVFGYTDSDVDSFASDTLVRQVMVDQVTASCSTNVRVCGFTRSNDDADLFEKMVTGPTGSRHKVRLRLTASSSSASDRLNRVLDDQKQQSSAAQHSFETGLCEADMLMYVGHARDGGGPDFEPARRRANGTTDFDYYRKNTPGVNRMSEKLQGCADGTAKVLGFLACDSSRWQSRLQRLAPKSGLILSATPKIPLEAALTQSYIALDSVLWMRCEGAFNKAMQQLDEYAGKSIIPPRIERFFRDTMTN